MSSPFTAVISCSSAGAGERTGLAEDHDPVTEGHQRGDGGDLRGLGHLLLGLGVDAAEDDVLVLLGRRLVDGANCRHGPHHDAQKSTRTMSLVVTVCSKESVVSGTALM